MASSGSVNSIGNTFARRGRAVRRYNPDSLNAVHQELRDKIKQSIHQHEKADAVTEEALKPKNKEKIPPELRPLKIERAEFYIQQNAVSHHTNMYELVNAEVNPSPVLRRGQCFYLALKSPRPYDPKRDGLKLIFCYGPNPNIARGTKVELSLRGNTKFSKPDGLWDVRVHHQSENDLQLEVKLPPTLYIGIWKCVISTKAIRGEKERKLRCPEDIYILFNPWCKDDVVFMDNEEWLKEYVLNDVGKLYMGVYRAPQGRNWIFAQFDDVILPSCLYLLDCAKLDFTARGDPIQIVRSMSAIINSRDDNGLLVDNWSGEYEDGVAPMDWTGSLKIFEDYMKNDGQPVKYGQCWVFSGCATTFCRALGIPCRSVTNYVSAHDCHHNLTVDKFHDCNGDLKTDVDQDSIWNFHVWNEAWMARSDLPKGYGGWQVVDSTPQEQSDDVYQMGPASKEAVRRGEIGLQYDTMFVVSEVNADIIHWQDDEESDIGMRKMRTFNYYIGKKILTKSVGKEDPEGIADAEDITDSYKNAEGSEEERIQVLNAARNAKLWYLYDVPRTGTEDVVFDLVEIDTIQIGHPFCVTVNIENKSKERRTVYAILSASTVFYTGVLGSLLKKEQQMFVLAPNQKEVLSIQVRGDEYVNKLVDYSMIKINATAKIKETQQVWVEEDDFSVLKPPIKLQIQGSPQMNQEFQMACYFVNPLETPLEQCHFSFEGSSISRPRTVAFRDINPGESIMHVEKFLPKNHGTREILVTFGSQQLKEISGATLVNIRKE